MDHVPSFFQELNRFTHSLREGLIAAAITWLMYLALEPIVRRNMPELIVSWNRLLAGDWRDPLVGRDVFLGALFGIAHMALAYVARFGERSLNHNFAIRLIDVNLPLSGPRTAFAMDLFMTGYGVVGGLSLICLLAILFLVFRRRAFAVAAFFCITTTFEILFFSHSLVFLTTGVAICVLLTFMSSRFGLVATAVQAAVFTALDLTLFTSNFSAWYSAPMLLTVFLIFLLLAYGFKVSIASQPLLGRVPSG
jgi:serine/threonine-protein kinase